MIVVVLVPWIVALVSAVLYLVSANTKAQQLALYAFAAAFLVAMLSVAGHVVRI